MKKDKQYQSENPQLAEACLDDQAAIKVRRAGFVANFNSIFVVVNFDDSVNFLAMLVRGECAGSIIHSFHFLSNFADFCQFFQSVRRVGWRSHLAARPPQSAARC